MQTERNVHKDWVTGLFEAIEYARVRKHAETVYADAELIDACSAYVARLGQLVPAAKRITADLTPTEHTIVDMIVRGISFCAAATICIPGTENWDKLSHPPEESDDPSSW